MTDWVGDDGRPKDFVGCSPEEYSRGICGYCGSRGQFTLEVTTDASNGFTQVVLSCSECSRGKKWSGNIDTDCF